MPKLRLPVLVALLLLGALLLAACGGGDDDDAATPTPTATAPATATAAGDAGTSVEVSLSEWAVRVAVGAIDAGEVAFTVANAGTLSHTFVIVRSDAAPRELLVVAGSVAEDEVDIVARIAPYAAGTTKRLTVDLDAGSYLLICNIPGHYLSGMTVAFTVN